MPCPRRGVSHCLWTRLLRRRRTFRHFENATRARGVEVAVFKAGAAEQIAPMMDEANAWGATALNVLSAPLFSFNRRIVIERGRSSGPARDL